MSIGDVKTHGGRHGDRKDIFDSQEEIHVGYANMHPMLLNDPFKTVRQNHQSYSNISRYFFNLCLGFTLAFYNIYELFCFNMLIYFAFTVVFSFPLNSSYSALLDL
jgi:hypothetical protein